MKDGIIIKVVSNLCTVMDQKGNSFNCRLKGKLRVKDSKSTNPISVGDRVLFEFFDGYEIGVIVQIRDRKNYIIRKSTNLSKQYHIIAANVDQALLMVTLKEPETSTDFIDRYLVSAEAFNIPVIIVFNKLDLYTKETLEKLKLLKKLYNEIGYDCIEISLLFKENLGGITNLLKGKITVINGNSGVGKSLLIKNIAPDLSIKIGEISSYHKSGVHTTSYSEMYKIGADSYIIDTPGIKAFGLIDFYKEELYHYFPEIFKIASECKFYNCRHIHEPGCAVLKALEQGSISTSRYNSYFNLFHDENEKYRT